jgi:hypothetical protein
MVKTRIAIAVAVLATAACTRDVPGATPPTTTVAPTNTHTGAPAASPTPTWTPPPTTTPPIQPGPHSALADINLPAGTVPLPPIAADLQDEDWRYTTPYADTVTFLQTQFATGRRYDSYGATWWNGLPPCYNDSKYNPADPAHESPPRGWILDNSTQWIWSDGAMTLLVAVWKPGMEGRYDRMIEISINPGGITCNRA